MRDTIFANITLYTTSEDKSRVDISEQLADMPFNEQFKILSLHKEQLISDLQNYDNPRHMKKNNTKCDGDYGEPTKEMLKIHLEITDRLILKIKEHFLNVWL